MTGFKILQMKQLGKHCVARIEDPDSINGEEILVFAYTDIDVLEKKEVIELHFLNRYSPFARFVPTKEGWDMAIAMAVLMGKYLK